MNRGYGEGGGFFGKKTKRDLAKEAFLKNQEQNEAMTVSSVKRTPEIPGLNDETLLKPHHLAKEQGEIPYDDDSKNRENAFSKETVDHSTEEDMEDWLDKKIEAEKNDPSLVFEKGTVTRDNYVLKNGKIIIDKEGQFNEEIEEDALDEKGWGILEDSPHLDENGNVKDEQVDNLLRKAEYKKDIHHIPVNVFLKGEKNKVLDEIVEKDNDSREHLFNTSAGSKVDDKQEVKKGKEGNWNKYKGSRRNLGRKREYKDKNTEDRKIIFGK